MNENTVFLRVATTNDAKELAEIYAPYVRETMVTFEYEIPSTEEFRARIAHTLEKYPYIVAVCGEKIVGYAYVSEFKSRPAYGWAVETTIYLRTDEKRRGIGRILYTALEGVCKAQNILNLIACIGYPDAEDEYLSFDSPRFHEHMGYSLVGEIHQCGFKFGRWYNIIFMEKQLGSHTENPLPVVPFSQLDPSILDNLNIRR